jgi:catecholate siderophore receptor
VAISFGAGIGTENEFFLNHIYTQTRDVPDFGVRFSGTHPLNSSSTGASDKTFWGDNRNFDDSDTRVTTAIFTHKFSDDTQLRTQLRSGTYNRAFWAKTPPTGATPAMPTFSGSAGGNVARYLNYETLNLQSDFSTKFELAGMKHALLSGVEYLKEDSVRRMLTDLDPTGGALYERHAKGNLQNSFNADNYALYVQDSVEFVPNWTALAGVRRDELHSKYSSATSPKLSYGENSYRTGLSWQPNPDRHYYATWSDSFSPTADLYQLTVVPQDPERSKTFEVGSKWLFMDGDLAVRTALFTTTKYWERNTDLEATSAILTRKRRTNGVEFEVTGKVTDRWDVFAGIALLDARVIKAAQNVAAGNVYSYADARVEGQRARNTPIGTLNIWTTYALTDAWKIGGGVEAKGERYAYQPGSANLSGSFVGGHFNPNSAPGYARVDLMASYEQPKWAVRLNVKNLLDKEYYDAVYDNGGLVTPGNRRQAIVTTEYKF